MSGVGPATVIGQTGEYRRLVEWVRAAWTEIQLLRSDWRFMWAQGAVNTIVGQADYTPNDLAVDIDYYDLGSFVLTDALGQKRPLRYVPYQTWKATFATGVPDNNTPTMVTDLPNESVRLSAPPDAIYPVTFDYYRAPQTLALNTDEPWLPERYHMLIVYKAMMYYAGYEDGKEVLVDATMRWNPLFDALETTQLPKIGFGHTPLGDE